MLAAQRSLFDEDPLGFDPRFRGIRRIQLEADAWIEHLPGWLSGHHRLFRQLHGDLEWRGGEREMYERTVMVPRLMATLPERGACRDALEPIRKALAKRYGERFVHVHLHRYRDGRDSVAMHADRSDAAGRRELVLPILSLGTPRRFLVRRAQEERRRPAVRGHRALGFRLGWGDLLVMGGRTALTWEHGVPKVSQVDGERISIMFRVAGPTPNK